MDVFIFDSSSNVCKPSTLNGARCQKLNRASQLCYSQDKTVFFVIEHLHDISIFKSTTTSTTQACVGGFICCLGRSVNSFAVKKTLHTLLKYNNCKFVKKINKIPATLHVSQCTLIDAVRMEAHKKYSNSHTIIKYYKKRQKQQTIRLHGRRILKKCFVHREY